MKTKHDSSVTQAVSGDVTAAATDRPTCVAGGHRADPPAEAVAVIEPPKPDNLPVAAGSDEVQGINNLNWNQLDRLKGRMISPKNCAKEVNVTTQTIHRWINQGKISAVKMSRKTVRVVGDSLVDFLNCSESIKKTSSVVDINDSHSVSAGSDEIQSLEGEMLFVLTCIRKALGIEHDEDIGIVPTIEKMRSQLNEWAQFGAVYGVATPQEMFDAIQRRNFTINDQNEKIAKLEDENSDLLLKLLEVNAGCNHSGDATDTVNHPPHYQGKVECIDAIESALGPDGFVDFCRGNALKYTFRAGRKGDKAEDLAKAAWYLQRIGQ